MIVAAHLEHGYTLAEIGRQTGLHYTTISKIITGAGVSNLTIHGLTLELHTSLYQVAELSEHRLLSTSPGRGKFHLPQKAFLCSGWGATT
jgi:hypothetical protein